MQIPFNFLVTLDMFGLLKKSTDACKRRDHTNEMFALV